MATTELLTYVSYATNSCDAQPNYYGASMIKGANNVKLDQCDASGTFGIKYSKFTSDVSVAGGKWVVTRRYESADCQGKLSWISATPFAESTSKCTRDERQRFYFYQTCGEDGSYKYVECSDDQCSKDCKTQQMNECMPGGAYKMTCSNGFTLTPNEFSKDEAKAKDATEVTKIVTDAVAADVSSPNRPIVDKTAALTGDASGKMVGIAVLFGLLATLF